MLQLVEEEPILTPLFIYLLVCFIISIYHILYVDCFVCTMCRKLLKYVEIHSEVQLQSSRK